MGTNSPLVTLSSSSYDGSLALSDVIVVGAPFLWRPTDALLRGSWLPLIPMTLLRFGYVDGRWHSSRGSNIETVPSLEGGVEVEADLPAGVEPTSRRMIERMGPSGPKGPLEPGKATPWCWMRESRLLRSLKLLMSVLLEKLSKPQLRRGALGKLWCW